MNIILNEIILITLYSLIQITLSQEFSSNNCSLYTDCFNCSIISSCRWNSSNEECIFNDNYNSNYSNLSMIQINNTTSNNLTVLNNYFNFIKKVCFLPTTPMINSNNNRYYNFKSFEYCGGHYIMTTDKDIKNLKVELKNVNDTYGLPNLFCEYIFFSGPNYFDINIKINQKEINDFYLLYSSDSLNFSQHINTTTTMRIDIIPNKINTLFFYGLKSFDSPPFTITYKPNIFYIIVQTTGYIMLTLIIIVLAIIIYLIIYVRKNSSLFKKQKEKIIKEKEKEKYKNIKDKTKMEEIALMKKNSNETNVSGPSIIKNFTPGTPINLLEQKKFSFDKCVVDGLFFTNKEEIYEAKCGHLYHKNCFNKLLKEMEESKDKKELKCVVCQKIISNK